MVFENYGKSLIQHCERSELRLHFEWTKVNQKMPKMVNFGEFLKAWSLRSNSVTRQVSLNRSKIGGKCQNWKIQIRHFGWFSNTVPAQFSLLEHLQAVQGRNYTSSHLSYHHKLTFFQNLRWFWSWPKATMKQHLPSIFILLGRRNKSWGYTSLMTYLTRFWFSFYPY